VIRRLTKKAFRAVKINYAWQMLAKHLNQRRAVKEERRVFQLWQGKLLGRIRARMFFIKFLELRGAKLLGLYSFKESKKLTDVMHKIQAA